jgi:uncharacterized membrane protein YhaH (DUF805 family)
MHFMKMLFWVRGRAGRATWWAGQAILVIANFVLITLGAGVTNASPLIASTQLLLLYLSYLLSAKRFQDRDVPGTTALYGYVLLAVVMLFDALNLTGATGQLNAVGWNAITITLGISIWLLIELGMLKGTPGPNRFGIKSSSGLAFRSL